MRLIDADELKEQLAKNIKTNDLGLWLNILQTIDNATTVEPCKDCEDKRQAEYIRHSSSWHELQALRKFKEEHERPQGEWARHDEWRNGEYIGGFYHIDCPCIDLETALYSRWETNFCPNCGAEMKRKPRDCEHCKHYVERDGSQGCESWECHFEDREDG